MTSAVASDTGVYYSTGREHDLSSAEAWHRLDTSSGDDACGVVLGVTGAEGALAWSASDGLRVVRLTRGSLDQPGLTRPGPVHHHPVAVPASAGAPLVALLTDGALDVLWSPDRHTVHRLNERPGIPAGPAEPRPELALRGERLGTLDIALESPKTAWLVATTERGALLLARWDLLYDVHEPWARPRCPLPTVRRAVVANVRGIPVVFVAAGEGRILAADARDAAADRAQWHVVEVPAGSRGTATDVIAAADCDGRAWLAGAAHGRLWSTPLARTGQRIVCESVTEATVD
ncbi:hypothetical protein ACIPSA_18355 [Streptomyces sp. NPDC086549]|uniref:hypothetical protein n=1 Tax=Streptomyces sp. NPDC086549 TaxID=3365752 RepID=UPI00381BFAF9